MIAKVAYTPIAWNSVGQSFKKLGESELDWAGVVGGTVDICSLVRNLCYLYIQVDAPRQVGRKREPDGFMRTRR